MYTPGRKFVRGLPRFIDKKTFLSYNIFVGAFPAPHFEKLEERIMTSKEYRAIARQKLSGNWGYAILTAIVAFYLGGLLVNSCVSLNLRLPDGDTIEISSVLAMPLGLLNLGGIWGIAQFIFGGPTRLGYCTYLLKLHDGQDADVNDLFSQYTRFTAGFCLHLLEGLYTFLWMLLFIIPGIIAIYRYAMAPFILAENPDMTASEALKASKALMHGHKAELFSLDISFLGWELLSILTLGIGAVWVNPYANSARAAFYRNISAAPSSPIAECLPEADVQ